MTIQQGGSVIGSEEYWYNDSHQRIAIVRRNAQGTKTSMVRFIGDVEAHYDGTGALVRVYSHPSLGTAVTRIERLGNDQTTAEHFFNGHGDNLIAAVSATGNVTARYVYSPFGSVLESESDTWNPADTHRRRFNDKYFDELSGLHYYGYRYYDATAMIWTQSDPLYRVVPDLDPKTPRRRLLYTFSMNNPNRYNDPDGRRPTDYAESPSQKKEEQEAFDKAAREAHEEYCKKNPERYACSGKVPDREITKSEAEGILKDLDFKDDGDVDLVINMILFMGPFDARHEEKTKETHKEATEATVATYGGNGHNDEADAFRHIYANMRFTQKYGKAAAHTAADHYERKNANPMSERIMDLHNNALGRQLGSDPKNASRNPREVVREAIQSGRAMTAPAKVQGNPIDPATYK